MSEFTTRRLIQFIPTLFLASVLVFLIIQLAPGDPALIMLGTEVTTEDIARERARLGLDRPLPVQYLSWLWGVARLDLGTSLVTRLPISESIGAALPNSLILAGVSLLLAVLSGTFLGIVAAIRPNSLIDSAITAFNSIGLAIPGFWLAILLVLLLSVRLQWLPPSGLGDGSGGFAGNLRYYVMPIAVLGFSNLHIFSRYVRSALLEVLEADYIRTARAKGLRERTVLISHALRNALIPVVTILGIRFGRLIGGAVLVESVFAYPGIGRLTISAILNRDYPVVQGVLMTVVVLFLIINFLVDLAYGLIDPRIRAS